MAARTVSFQPVGFNLEVSRTGSFGDIPGQVDLAVAGDAATINNLELLNGEALTSRGSVPAETITSQLVWNPASSVIKALIAAKYSGDTMSFRINTPAPFYVYEAITASKYVSAARDATTGLSRVTLSGTNAIPALGDADTRGIAGVGHYFVVDGNNGFAIDAIPGEAMLDIAVPSGYTTVTSPSDYLGIVQPQLRNTFQATVTNIGNFTAAATGEAVTDSLELAAVSSIGENYVVNFVVA